MEFLPSKLDIGATNRAFQLVIILERPVLAIRRIGTIGVSVGLINNSHMGQKHM